MKTRPYYLVVRPGRLLSVSLTVVGFFPQLFGRTVVKIDNLQSIISSRFTVWIVFGIVLGQVDANKAKETKSATEEEKAQWTLVTRQSHRRKIEAKQTNEPKGGSFFLK